MFSQKILEWYDKAHRTLPWRLGDKNPYYTWLSEIMLQQTTVATVIPYFHAFVKRWPTIQDLANASLDDILTQWQGLGYYSRARHLHQCAQALAKEFPTSESELLQLPGIGPYTAAAIASIAFERKAAAVDGNVVRVLTRYFAISSPQPAREVKEKLHTLLPEMRCGDFTQALMELGALACRPKKPLCSSCPLQEECRAYNLKKVQDFPVKKTKQKLPTRYATAFILRRQDGAILLRKRPSQGLLGGMMEVPTTPWTETYEGKRQGPIVRHIFSHFHLEVEVCHALDNEEFTGVWVKPQNIKDYALPTVMKKILKVGLREP